MEFLSQNKIDYSWSINDVADKCHTSRTSVLRLAKKLGFKGYSELKYYLSSVDIKKDQKEEVLPTEKSYQISDDLKEVFDKLLSSKNIYIYGNGDYEEIISLYIKKLLLNQKILAETYKGEEEIRHFTHASMDDSTIFVVDFSKNDLAKNLLINISHLACLKIFVGKATTRHKIFDYNLKSSLGQKKETMLISPAIKAIESFFIKLKEYRENNENT